MSMSASLHSLIYERPAVSLDAIAPLSLLDRVDYKFVLHPEQLDEMTAAVLGKYQVLEVKGVRPNRYLTSYFDTPEFAMYFDHHNGKRSRYKVRCRSYLDSGVAFVETKMKTNRERTVKSRRQIPVHTTTLNTLERDWIPPTFPYSVEEMHAVVWNRFIRTTLVNFEHNERITIDTDIVFGSGVREFQYEGMCVVEVKHPKFSLMGSPLTRQLHQMHLQPQSISKFCVAAIHFYPECKLNHFKPLILQLNRSFPLRGIRERFT